jgi:hypothetical protein
MLLIVRRGQEERYGHLRAAFQGEPVEVIWDRRQGERRQHPASVERRRGDRRAEAPVPLPSELDNRRLGDRRYGEVETRIPERRRGERRGLAPVSWTALDFVFVREVAP